MTDIENTFSEVTEALSSPGFFDNKSGEISIIDTHVSKVFLFENDVFKLKKAVDFGFLNFTSLDQRREACIKEVTLNRRTTEGIYIGVVSVIFFQGKYKLSDVDDPEALEYLVHMKRLPQESMLDQRLKQGTFSDIMATDLGNKIADFHTYSTKGDHISQMGSYEGVKKNVEENFSQLIPYIGQTVEKEIYDEIVDYSRSFMKKRKNLFIERAENKFVRDVHGDLRTEQISVTDDGIVSILDCIEFNDRMRWIDTASDLAFILMDLEHKGSIHLADKLLESYFEKAADPNIVELLSFYKCYRAFVRGKIESFLIDDSSVLKVDRERIKSRAKSYFDLARRYANSEVDPEIILIGGLMGTGKTTLATQISRNRGHVRVSTDEARKSHFGLPTETHLYDRYGEGIYDKKSNKVTYEKLYSIASRNLNKGHSVVVDASFSDKNERQRFYSLGAKLNLPIKFVLCSAPEEVIKKRLLDREKSGRGPSDGRWDLYEDQKRSYHPLDQSKEQYIEIDTNQEKSDTFYKLFSMLGEYIF
jgi:aminoglycoside phosphotransferase family enzyme/predicted kinase